MPDGRKFYLTHEEQRVIRKVLRITLFSTVEPHHNAVLMALANKFGINQQELNDGRT